MVDIQVGEPDVKPPMINTLSAVDTVAYRVILEMNLTNDFGNNRNFLISYFTCCYLKMDNPTLVPIFLVHNQEFRLSIHLSKNHVRLQMVTSGMTPTPLHYYGGTVMRLRF